MLADDDAQFARVRGNWNRIRFIAHHHLGTIRREPALSRLVFQELRPDPVYRQTRLFALSQAYTHRIIDVIQEGIEQGEFRSDVSPTLVRDMIYGCIEHLTWAYLRNEGDFDAEATADEIADMIYGGLVVRRPEDEPIAKALARMEDVTARLERLGGRGD
jgi:TetR/AcrR family transcriptional regulator, fatty acid metabolism regulator protein